MTRMRCSRSVTLLACDKYSLISPIYNASRRLPYQLESFGNKLLSACARRTARCGFDASTDPDARSGALRAVVFLGVDGAAGVDDRRGKRPVRWLNVQVNMIDSDFGLGSGIAALHNEIIGLK